jgi:hemerythrin-like domain-containing protein
MATKETQSKRRPRARTATHRKQSATRPKPSARRARRASTSASSGRRPDALAVLREDHRTLRAILDALKTARGERRQQTFERAERELKRHTELEESIFYPAFRAAAQTKKDRQMFHEATEEHHAVDVVLPEVRNALADDDVFSARLKVLTELVRHHMEEEESEMFPRARTTLGSSELHALGERLRAASPRAARGPAISPLRAVASLVGMGR